MALVGVLNEWFLASKVACCRRTKVMVWLRTIRIKHVDSVLNVIMQATNDAVGEKLLHQTLIFCVTSMAEAPQIDFDIQ